MPIGTSEETFFNRQNMDFDRQSLRSVGRQPIFERPGSDIKKTGMMKKMKTMKKKFFVLRSTSSSGPARLEYYDSEKKFKSGQPAKHPIQLHTCFNINKKSDSRHGKYGIVLFTSNECFTFLTESEEEQNSWLSLMLDYQDEYLPEGHIHKEHYDHVWQVTVQPKGLGLSKGSKGPFRLCLNSSLVSLVKPNGSLPHYTIQLVTIRSVAHNDCSFRMEVGKYAPTGEGEFWFSVEDSSVAKDMHETLLRYMNSVKDTAAGLTNQSSFRSRTGSQHSPGRQRNSMRAEQQRPSSCYQPPSGWPSYESPSSPNYPQDMMRTRTNTGESRKSYNHHEEFCIDFPLSPDMDNTDSHISVVPEDMSPPSSPGCLDEQVRSYMEMDMKKNEKQPSNVTSTSPGSSSYLKMGTSPFGQTYGHKEVSSPITDTYCSMGPSAPESYLMMGHHQPSSQMSAPIPIHSFPESHHPSPLPTVREGGSNEGYLPMDISNSPASSSGILRPEPAKCMLSDDSTGLPPRTYSLGSRPVAKKEHSYIEMGPRNSAGSNDMSRATSAPHIINKARRQEKEQNTDSPTTSASPLSMSLKSDDSDSFMEYMSMRPRTASDSFNYRPRTSSFGKLQPSCRPRSSSHGQGTRPFSKFNKLAVEQSRISQDPMHRTSMESSLQGSFDSLRVSNESLRKTSQEIRKKSGSNASDYAEMRGTPSPQLKLVSSEPDGYVNMQPGTAGRKSSPHRMRSDSSGSGRRPDIKTNNSDRPQQHPHLQQIDDYTEMAPTNVSSGSSRDSYMNMDYRARQSDGKSMGAATPSSLSNDSEYMAMELDAKKSRSDTGRSVSMENVDTYVLYDPSHSAGNKQRTGSLGSKDKQIFRPTSSRKPSSASMSSCSSSSNTIQPSVSTSTRTGGSSDSIRKPSRQSSMEKYCSLGKDFRKKSGSTGSRPSSTKLPFSVGKDHNAPGFGLMPERKPSSASATADDLDDEYIEFSPTVTKGDNSHQTSHHSAQLHSSVQPGSHPSRGGSFSSSHPLPSPAEEEAYTLYNPAPQFTSKAVHFQPQKPAPSKLNIPTSSSARPGPAKDVQDYVGFEPGPSNHPVVSPTTSHRKPDEAQEYVEYQPATAAGYFTFSPSPHPQEPSRTDGQEYVGYEPGPVSAQGSGKPVSPNSVMSYIKGDSTAGKSKQSQPPKQQQTFSDCPKRQQTFSDFTNKSSRVDSAPGKLSPSNSVHKIEPPGQIFTFPGNSPWSSTGSSYTTQPLPATNARNVQHPGTDKAKTHTAPVSLLSTAPPISSTAPPFPVLSTAPPVSSTAPPFPVSSTAPPFPVSNKTLSSDPNKHCPQSCTAQQSNDSTSNQPKPQCLSQSNQQHFHTTQSNQQCFPATQSSQSCLATTESSQSCSPTTEGGQQSLTSTQSNQSCLATTESSQSCSPTTQSSLPCLPVIQSNQQCSPLEQSCLKPQGCPQNNISDEDHHYVSYNPAQSGSFKSPNANLASEKPFQSACLLQGSQTTKPSVFTQLTIDTGVENSFQGNGSQPQKNSHGYLRQTSAPASIHPSQASDLPATNTTAQPPQMSSESPVAEDKKLKNVSGVQTPFNPQAMSPVPTSENSKRHKHLSGSSSSDVPSPSASANRHKHPSGSSISSQKSRKASTDSEKSISKGSKSDSKGSNQSDSNSSLNLSGGKSKRVMPSGEKSPGSSAEKSPMSPSRSGIEFFCGEASPVTGKDLEAKMAVVTAKIQHSLGDKEGHGQSLRDMMATCGKDGHGLIRPGSTPCMQNLDAVPDVSRSAGDTPNFSRSCCLQFSSSSRTRHSIPDLGNYQQMNFASSPGLVSTGSEQKVNTSGSNSGSGESCGSTHSEPAFKPLIYVKLDLGGPEGQGDADSKVPRIKSRNSSDADEKQPPLSYAQIDFVKSQNLSKGKSMTMAGGDKS